jgi:hypothetical protein
LANDRHIHVVKNCSKEYKVKGLQRINEDTSEEISKRSDGYGLDDQD